MINHVAHPGSESFSPAKAIGSAMAEYMKAHPNFYLFSPDETTSNKLDAVFDVSARAWNLPEKPFDLPEAPNGQVIEMLSENTLFACMAGHLISGEPAMMTSYEAFFSIISAQLLQHLKFLQQSAETPWRPAYPAANLLSTSTCWRQDHNGFTHQSPALISQLLALPSSRVNCLFPLDDVAAEATFIYMCDSKNVVNLTTFNKTDQPRWLNSHQADAQFNTGAMIIEPDQSATEASAKSEPNPSTKTTTNLSATAKDPDYVLVGVGDIVSNEAIQALKILRTDFPEKSFRFINLSALSYNAIGTTDHKLSQTTFDQLFGPSKKSIIIANFHGYPATLEHILLQYAAKSRLHVHGYEERGSTTTPFEMFKLNRASRYHLALDVAEREKRSDLIEKYRQILQDNTAYAHEHGLDQIQ